MPMRYAAVIIVCLFTFICLCGCSNFSETHSTLDVDLSQTVKLQVLYNEHIYNTKVSYDGQNMHMSFEDDDAPYNGTQVKINSQSYNISYMDMKFHGELKSLVTSFMPVIVYNSFGGKSILHFEEYDVNSECYILSQNASGCFLEYSAYTKNNEIYLYLEIK